MYQCARDKPLHTVGSDFVLLGHSLRRGACGVSSRGLCARFTVLPVLLIYACPICPQSGLRSDPTCLTSMLRYARALLQSECRLSRSARQTLHGNLQLNMNVCFLSTQLPDLDCVSRVSRAYVSEVNPSNLKLEWVYCVCPESPISL